MNATRRRLMATAAIAAVAGSACSGPERLPPVPRGDTARALPLGLRGLRFFADSSPEALAADFSRELHREAEALRAAGHRGPLPPANFLAVSGGGDDGAFGAGLLCAWTETGTRPTFHLVTGISTGSLIAPFAFLGPAYDPALRQVYTAISPDDIFRSRSLLTGVFSDAMADTSPLAGVIARHVDDKFLAAIAAEYKKGRLLLIGTTDLDAERPVIWDMGAIAASGHPGALNLFRQILRASAAVPGAFQPVLIDVELDGRKLQELHVDGGAIAQMFLYPPSMRLTVPRERHAYLIRNGRVDANWAATEPRTLSVVGRAIGTMISSSGRNDMLRIYYTCQRDRVDYNLAFIGSDFNAPHATDFDRTYMNALFDYAYRQAKAGYRWHKRPPDLARS